MGTHACIITWTRSDMMVLQFTWNGDICECVHRKYPAIISKILNIFAFSFFTQVHSTFKHMYDNFEFVTLKNMRINKQNGIEPYE